MKAIQGQVIPANCMKLKCTNVINAGLNLMMMRFRTETLTGGRMSEHQMQIYIENLIKEYNRLKDLWNGSDLGIERKMDEIAGELSDLGVDV